jgi:hypothetical protein
MAYYRRRRNIFLMATPICLCHGGRCLAEHIHHSRGRAGTLLLDERFWIPLCFAAHELIQEHPDVARRADLLCAKGEWNVAPNDAETERLRDLIIELTR